MQEKVTETLLFAVNIICQTQKGLRKHSRFYIICLNAKNQHICIIFCG